VKALGRFKIEPNPPIAGQPATVTYTGSEREVTWQVPGQRPTTRKVPPKTFEIDPVPHGDVLILSDDTDDEGTEFFPIDETE
jgi:hypothetical protein